MPAGAFHTDQQLLDLLCQKSDEAAFRILYERYWHKLFSQALLVLKSKEEAEEVVQEVFLHIWRRRDTLEIRHTFYTYIASMAKYEVLQRLAKKKASHSFQQRAGTVFVEQDHSTEAWLGYEALRESLEASVMQLPEKCRLVFRLSREAGLSEKQIAETLHISVKTVEAHIGKALKSLRVALHQFLGSMLSLLLFINFLK